MPIEEKKGITVKVDAGLHAEVRAYIESHGMTMSEFVTLALTDELHPKFHEKEEKYMGNMRTVAFQVPEDLFQRIKDYLQRNNMTQKEFLLGLIEDELEREQTEREQLSAEREDASTEDEETTEEQEETAPVSDFEPPCEDDAEIAEEQDGSEFSDDCDEVSEEENDDEFCECDSDEDEDESENEAMGLSMRM